MANKKKLSWCPVCKENSTITKIYFRKHDNKRCRALVCINHGCGYSEPLPFPEDFK